MKRFYQNATVVSGDEGFEVRLDGRPVRTPARALLALPNAAFAEAVAEEWRGQREAIDPLSMPFTGLANGAIDQIAPNREDFAAGISRYAQSDLLCYRADGPTELVDRQARAWNPLLDWALQRYDVAFRVTQGVIAVEQPAETLNRLAEVVAAFDPFTLAGLSTMVTLSGSLVCGLAVLDGAWDAQTVWTAAEIDEAWQFEQWGEDAEAAARSARRSAEFLMAQRFSELARG